MKSKTKPEEPRKKEVKFVCQAEHWKSDSQSRRKTRAGSPNVVSVLGFQLQEHKHAHWGIVFKNSCRMRRSALLRRMASLSMSASDMVVDLQGEISSAHCGPCTKTLSHQTMPQQARKLLGNDCSAYHRLDQTVPA